MAPDSLKERGKKVREKELDIFGCAGHPFSNLALIVGLPESELAGAENMGNGSPA